MKASPSGFWRATSCHELVSAPVSQGVKRPGFSSSTTADIGRLRAFSWTIMTSSMWTLTFCKSISVCLADKKAHILSLSRRCFNEQLRPHFLTSLLSTSFLISFSSLFWLLLSRRVAKCLPFLNAQRQRLALFEDKVRLRFLWKSWKTCKFTSY